MPMPEQRIPVNKWGKTFWVTREFLADASIDVDAYLIRSAESDCRNQGASPIIGSGTVRYLDPYDPADAVWISDDMPENVLVALVSLRCVGGPS